MKIKIQPGNIEIEGSPDKSLLQICIENKVFIKSTCKGVPNCGDCRVKIIEGEHNVLPPTKTELNLIGTNYYIDGRRLACQAKAFGNVTLDLSEHLEKTDSANKKIRGFRSPHRKDQESMAVQGTLILEEKSSSAAAASVYTPSSSPFVATTTTTTTTSTATATAPIGASAGSSGAVTSAASASSLSASVSSDNQKESGRQDVRQDHNRRQDGRRSFQKKSHRQEWVQKNDRNKK